MAFQRSAVVLTLLAALGCNASYSSQNAVVQEEIRATNERFAAKWMQNTDPGDQAALDELKEENPDSFAIVNALLTKQSLGLLNSKHPTASFAPGDDAPVASSDRLQVPAAPQVVQASEPQPAFEVPVAAMAVAAPHSHANFFNWKPHSGDDEDAMVKDVLGAAESLRSGGTPPAAPPAASASLVSHSRTESTADLMPAHSSNNADVAGILAHQAEQQLQPAPKVPTVGSVSFDWGNVYAGSGSSPQKKSAPPPAPVAVAPAPDLVNNPYLNMAGIDVNGDLGNKPAANAPKPAVSMAATENSYLKGFLGENTAPAASSPKVAKKSGNPLASFSWYSDEPSRPNTQYLQQPKAAKKADPVIPGVLGKWLA